MPLEIERKFLVKQAHWREMGFRVGLGRSATEMFQGYLPAGNGVTVRVRRCAGQKDVLAVKTGSGITRIEIETMISKEDADALFLLCGDVKIHKMRWHLGQGGVTWEVDKFFDKHEGLMLAEIELEDEDQRVDLPHWVGQEVTNDVRYSNHSLAIHGLSQLPKKNRKSK